MNAQVSAEASLPEEATTATAGETAAFLKARVIALLTLAALIVAAVAGARTAWLAATDSWVAPIRLSPDNDRIVALRVERARQLTERERLLGELAATSAELEGIRSAIDRLRGLATGYSGAVAWTLRAQREELGSLAAQEKTLDEQRALLEQSESVQVRLVEKSRADLAGGVITAAVFEREELALQQVRLTLKTNERDREKLRVARKMVELRGVALTRDGGARRRDDGERSVDAMRFDEQRVRIQLEVTRLEAEERAGEARRRSLETTLAAIRELEDDLRLRPLYRAMTAQTDLAFVPYTQLDGVERGDRVLRCALGVFNCRDVGIVDELVQGEVVTQDPWGELARGQYVVLKVDDPAALREKVLRVRSTGAKPVLPREPTSLSDRSKHVGIVGAE